MRKRHTFEEKCLIIKLHEEGACMVELMERFHVRDHFLYILFGRYKKYGLQGLGKFTNTVSTNELKQSVLKEYLEDSLPLWQICVKYDISYTTICRWVQMYKLGGYDLLLHKKTRGLSPKKMGRPRKKEPQTELEKLELRLKYLEAENALLKKAKALMEAEESRPKDSGRKSSKR